MPSSVECATLRGSIPAPLLECLKSHYEESQRLNGELQTIIGEINGRQPFSTIFYLTDDQLSGLGSALDRAHADHVVVALLLANWSVVLGEPEKRVFFLGSDLEKECNAILAGYCSIIKPIIEWKALHQENLVCSDITKLIGDRSHATDEPLALYKRFAVLMRTVQQEKQHKTLQREVEVSVLQAAEKVEKAWNVTLSELRVLSLLEEQIANGEANDERPRTPEKETVFEGNSYSTSTLQTPIGQHTRELTTPPPVVRKYHPRFSRRSSSGSVYRSPVSSPQMGEIEEAYEARVDEKRGEILALKDQLVKAEQRVNTCSKLEIQNEQEIHNLNQEVMENSRLVSSLREDNQVQQQQLNVLQREREKLEDDREKQELLIQQLNEEMGKQSAESRDWRLKYQKLVAGNKELSKRNDEIETELTFIEKEMRRFISPSSNVGGGEAASTDLIDYLPQVSALCERAKKVLSLEEQLKSKQIAVAKLEEALLHSNRSIELLQARLGISGDCQEAQSTAVQMVHGENFYGTSKAAAVYGLSGGDMTPALAASQQRLESIKMKMGMYFNTSAGQFELEPNQLKDFISLIGKTIDDLSIQIGALRDCYAGTRNELNALHSKIAMHMGDFTMYMLDNMLDRVGAVPEEDLSEQNSELALIAKRAEFIYYNPELCLSYAIAVKALECLQDDFKVYLLRHEYQTEEIKACETWISRIEERLNVLKGQKALPLIATFWDKQGGNGYVPCDLRRHPPITFKDRDYVMMTQIASETAGEKKGCQEIKIKLLQRAARNTLSFSDSEPPLLQKVVHLVVAYVEYAQELGLPEIVVTLKGNTQLVQATDALLFGAKKIAGLEFEVNTNIPCGNTHRELTQQKLCDTLFGRGYRCHTSLGDELGASVDLHSPLSPILC